jgi:hypothetical protein
MYYIAKVKFEVQDENGKMKKFRENYLVEGISVTEAEALVTRDLMGEPIDFEIEGVQKSNIIKIINSESAPE